VRRLLQTLKSVKLAVVLIAYLAVAGMLATLVPQGLEADFYAGAYPKLLAEVVVQSGFTRFFTSLAFLLPSFLFFANLAACSIDRFLREIRRTGKRRHGPDVLHLGLLVLVVGAVLSFSGRQEGAISLSKGDRVEMPDGRILVLADFSYRTYPDGRPLDWTSTVDVEKDGRAEVRGFPIRVNHPLRLGGMSIYQVSHATERQLAVRDPAGTEHLLPQGGQAEHGGMALYYMAPEQGTGRAVVRLTRNSGAEVLRLAPGQEAEGFAVTGFRDVDVTGLEAVVDPGYPVVLAALALVTVAAFFTLARKIGDMKP
jgi:hypothetical protein